MKYLAKCHEGCPCPHDPWIEVFGSRGAAAHACHDHVGAASAHKVSHVVAELIEEQRTPRP